MELITPPPALQQDCLDKLSRALDLVLKTAEAASAENNHKLVIQSAREVTRIAGLIHKMTSSRTKPAPSPRGGLAAAKTAAPWAPAKQTSSRPEPTGEESSCRRPNENRLYSGGSHHAGPRDALQSPRHGLFGLPA